MKPRVAVFPESTKYGANIYTYADSINRALQQGIISTAKPKVPPLKGLSTMSNTKGRDNKMYFISDGFNLDKSKENCFTSLLTLSGVTSNIRQLPSLRSPSIGQIKSQTIQRSTMSPSSLRPPEKLCMSTLKLNRPSMGSALGMHATERTSAATKFTVKNGVSSTI